MHKLLVLVATTGLLACGGGTPPVVARPAPAAAAATRPPTVELAELKFYAGGDLGMQLHADGHLVVKAQAQWVDIGSLAADGTIRAPDGTPRGHITRDGSLVGPSGRPAAFHLEGTTLVVGDKKLTIDDRGILQGGNLLQGQMRVEGATTPGLRRTALVLLASLMTSGRR